MPFIKFLSTASSPTYHIAIYVIWPQTHKQTDGQADRHNFVSVGVVIVVVVVVGQQLSVNFLAKKRSSINFSMVETANEYSISLINYQRKKPNLNDGKEGK